MLRIEYGFGHVLGHGLGDVFGLGHGHCPHHGRGHGFSHAGHGADVFANQITLSSALRLVADASDCTGQIVKHLDGTLCCCFSSLLATCLRFSFYRCCTQVLDAPFQNSVSPSQCSQMQAIYSQLMSLALSLEPALYDAVNAFVLGRGNTYGHVYEDSMAPNADTIIVLLPLPPGVSKETQVSFETWSLEFDA